MEVVFYTFRISFKVLSIGIGYSFKEYLIYLIFVITLHQYAFSRVPKM